MQWMVWVEARTSAGGVATTELVACSRPGVVGTLAEIGHMLTESKTLWPWLQASMLCAQVAEHAAHHRACVDCGALRPLKDRRTRRLQALFGTDGVEAPRFKVCRCRLVAPLAEAALFSPVCARLSARCTPELERVQAELGARPSFRDAVGLLDRLLPALPTTLQDWRAKRPVSPKPR